MSGVALSDDIATAASNWLSPSGARVVSARWISTLVQACRATLRSVAAIILGL
jgi:hypothetical protein